MKKRIIKRICIGIGIVLVLLVALYILFVNFLQEKAMVLEQEFAHIEDLVQRDTIDYNRIYYYTDRTVLDGTFGAVERATKNYIRDVYKELEGLETILSSLEFQGLLSAEAILEDGPLFTNSQAYVEQTREELQQTKDKLLSLLEQDKIMEYFDDVQGFLSGIIQEELEKSITDDFQNTKEDVEVFINTLDDYLVLVSNTMTFLTNHQDSWEFDGEYITFATDELYNTYEAFITRMNDLSYQLNSI